MGSANVLSKDHPSQKRETTPAFPTWKSAGALDELLVDRPIKKVIEPQDQEKQSPLDKTPSNVRKMVLAFETNPVKEVSPGISKTRSVPRISTTAMLEAPVRVPSVKRTIGANAKPAPMSEGTEKEPGENQDYGPSTYEEQLVEKPEQPKDLKPQNIDDVSSEKDRPKVQPPREEQKEDLEVQSIDDMSSKNDIPKMQPTTKGQNEEKQHLELQNVNSMSSKMDITKIEPIREEKKDEKKDLDPKVQNINYMPSKKDALEMQLSKEERKEEKDLKLQNIDYISSKKDMPKMQTSREEQKVEKKDMPKMQPTEEEQKEEKKDLKPQKIGYLSSKKDMPIVQPAGEEQQEEKRDKLQNIDYMSSKKDLPKMQPIGEEVKEDKKDLKLLNFDIPKIQPTREEQKEEENSPKKLHLLSAAESSRLSWGGLVQAFPSGNQSSPDISTELQRSLCCEPFVIKKNWRSKHWKSLQRKVKSNMTYWNLTDSDLAPNINEKTSGQRKSLDSGSSSSNNGNSRRPIGQPVKIAIMVGFGILVFLNRQRR